MAFDFPNSPTNGQVYGNYTWDAATGAWKLTTSSGSGGGGSITISDTPPASPTPGSLWWESDTGILYINYNDGNSSQWVVVSAASGGSGSGRLKLVADTTYFVRTDGNDVNNGLANTAGGAFLTIKRALDVVAELDCGAFTPTVQVGAGNWTVSVVLPRVLCAGASILTGVGNTTVINYTYPLADGTIGSAILNDGAGIWQVNNLKVMNGGANSCNGITVRNGGTVKVSGVEFGPCISYQAIVYPNSALLLNNTFTVSGGSYYGFSANGGFISLVGATITYVGTVAYIGANFCCFSSGYLEAYAIASFAGSFASVTGQRYVLGSLGVIFTSGAGPNYFPGSVAGTISAFPAGTYA